MNRMNRFMKMSGKKLRNPKMIWHRKYSNSEVQIIILEIMNEQ